MSGGTSIGKLYRVRRNLLVPIYTVDRGQSETKTKDTETSETIGLGTCANILDTRCDLVFASHVRNLRDRFCRDPYERRHEHVGRPDSKIPPGCGLKFVFHLNAPFTYP